MITYNPSCTYSIFLETIRRNYCVGDTVDISCTAPGTTINITEAWYVFLHGQNWSNPDCHNHFNYPTLCAYKMTFAHGDEHNNLKENCQGRRQCLPMTINMTVTYRCRDYPHTPPEYVSLGYTCALQGKWKIYIFCLPKHELSWWKAKVYVVRVCCGVVTDNGPQRGQLTINGHHEAYTYIYISWNLFGPWNVTSTSVSFGEATLMLISSWWEHREAVIQSGNPHWSGNPVGEPTLC